MLNGSSLHFANTQNSYVQKQKIKEKIANTISICTHSMCWLDSKRQCIKTEEEEDRKKNMYIYVRFMSRSVKTTTN